jgi:hypothetical protein
LELKLFGGALFILGTAATHFAVSMNTNFSERNTSLILYQIGITSTT